MKVQNTSLSTQEIEKFQQDVRSRQEEVRQECLRDPEISEVIIRQYEFYQRQPYTECSKEMLARAKHMEQKIQMSYPELFLPDDALYTDG